MAFVVIIEPAKLKNQRVHVLYNYNFICDESWIFTISRNAMWVLIRYSKTKNIVLFFFLCQIIRLECSDGHLRFVCVQPLKRLSSVIIIDVLSAHAHLGSLFCLFIFYFVVKSDCRWRWRLLTYFEIRLVAFLRQSRWYVDVVVETYSKSAGKGEWEGNDERNCIYSRVGTTLGSFSRTLSLDSSRGVAILRLNKTKWENKRNSVVMLWTFRFSLWSET